MEAVTMAVFKKGRSWYIDYYLKGVRKRKKIGPSKHVAELALAQVQVKIAKGEYLGIYDDKRITLAQFSEEYLAYARANKAPMSVRRDLISLVPLSAAFPDYLSAITTKTIEEYKVRRLQTVKPATINKELALLKHMFTKAIEWGYVKQNPAKPVKLLKEPPGRLRYLTPEELIRLLEACAPHLKPIVLTAVHTGMRRREILSLRWADVDLRKRMITLTKTKNNERRICPINGQLAAVLRTVPRHVESPYVFCDREGQPYDRIDNGFRRACKRAGIVDFRFHDLRHTFASHLIMRGANLRSVQELLGHKTGKMTVRYTHLSTPHLQETVTLLDTLFVPASRGVEQGG
jgi:integrase